MSWAWRFGLQGNNPQQQKWQERALLLLNLFILNWIPSAHSPPPSRRISILPRRRKTCSLTRPLQITATSKSDKMRRLQPHPHLQGRSDSITWCCVTQPCMINNCRHSRADSGEAPPHGLIYNTSRRCLWYYFYTGISIGTIICEVTWLPTPWGCTLLQWTISGFLAGRDRCERSWREKPAERCYSSSFKADCEKKKKELG